MKKLIVLLTFVLVANMALAEDPVDFADENLEAAVRLELEIPEPTPIYPSDMLGLTDLGAYNAGIVSLVGLEHAANLTSLRLGANMISDLGPLSGLTSLEELALYSNQISELEPISGVTSLRLMNLNDNTISNISHLSGLTNLIRLTLVSNEIRNINAVSGMTSLYHLDLRYNYISDISPLLSLTELIELRLENNPLDCLAYDIYIPQIIANNPGISINYDPRPVECPFQVNTETENDQINPYVAMDVDGDFVIAWQSFGQDGDGYGIYAQRYNSDGTPEGGEFLVNTYTTNSQVNPSVAMNADGDFVIAWQSYGQDGDGWGIYAQRYNSDGTPNGNEFVVNTETADSQQYPAVAMDADGDFVIAWLNHGISFGIYAQRYHNDGTPAGGEFPVNTEVVEINDSYPSVAMDVDGDFIIVWPYYYEQGLFTIKQEIKAQIFDSNGASIGGVLDIVSDSENFVDFPSVAMDADGNFVIAWCDDDEIKAQIYNSDGTPASAGNGFRVNTETLSYQEYPSVAMDSDGDFVITWQSLYQDGHRYGIYAQWYSSGGTAIGGEYQVNTYIADDQEHPCVAMDSDGNSVIAWQSYGQDGDGYGIYARMLSAGAGGSVEEICLVLDDASNVISGLIIDEPEVFINNLVMYRLEATIEEVLVLLLPRADVSPYEEALKTLEKKVITKMDGCAVSGSPDAGDWIITCEAQDQVYPLIFDAIELLQQLLGQ